MVYFTRLAVESDIPSITTIYNQGIEDRIATLEIESKTIEERKKWLTQREERFKVLVIHDEKDTVYGWASLNVFNGRCCYSGVADLSIYIERSMRGKGLGKQLMKALIETAKNNGFHKLVLSTFSFNHQGIKLYTSVGFRIVGTYEKHGILDGNWVDVTIMEKLL
ncbi:MAG TPA: arsinothricin resistance N-acetyltransferase ArsN1 family A [Clostridia bacterium]